MYSAPATIYNEQVMDFWAKTREGRGQVTHGLLPDEVRDILLTQPFRKLCVARGATAFSVFYEQCV